MFPKLLRKRTETIDAHHTVTNIIINELFNKILITPLAMMKPIDTKISFPFVISFRNVGILFFSAII